MKTTKRDQWQVTGDRQERLAQAGNSCCVLRVPCPVCAFSLIELLVVIAIIAILAALILPVAGAVKRRAYIQTAQAEMAQIEAAIGRYHAAYGFYPPENHENPVNPLVSPLYYELVGTTNTAGASVTPSYQVLGDPTGRQLTGGAGGEVSQAFGVGGFMNCDKPNASESAPHAQDFLPDLKPDEYDAYFTNNKIQITVLVTADGGPDPKSDPIKYFGGNGNSAPGVNPWRYRYPGVNNPNSYDLWIQLVFKPGDTNLICNWSKQVQVNNPLP